MRNINFLFLVKPVDDEIQSLCKGTKDDLVVRHCRLYAFTHNRPLRACRSPSPSKLTDSPHDSRYSSSEDSLDSCPFAPWLLPRYHCRKPVDQNLLRIARGEATAVD